MAPASMNKAKTGANAVFYVVMVIGALVALNVIATRLVKRVDFTEDKIYTLSQASKDLVKTLPDRMTVKAFISKDLPPHDTQTAQYVRDLLEEYASASGGKIKWESIDPGEDKALQEEAEKLKVPRMTRPDATKGKITIGSNYLGVAFEYQGNIESLPSIQGPQALEFQMTSLIKMLAVKKKKIVFASAEGELPIGDGGQQAHNGLSILKPYLQDYQIESTPLTKLLADDVDALVIAGPRTAASPRAKFVVDQFLMKGKPVVFLIDGMIVESPGGMQMPGNNQMQMGRKNDHGFDDLLDHYGFKIHDDLIMEPRLNVPGVVMVKGRPMLANYPTFTAAVRLDANSPITSRLKGIIFPMASSVEFFQQKQPGLTATVLAQSSPDAWHQSGMFVMDPETPLKPGPDKGTFNYAYAAEGKLTSFFAGKTHPNEKGEQVPAPAPNASAAPGEETVIDSSQTAVRMVVVGNSGFTSDEYLRLAQYVQSYGANVLFTMSILDWMVQDETLTKLRAKTVQSRPIKVESEATAKLIKYGNVVAIPLFFVLFGVLRARMRRNWRNSFKL